MSAVESHRATICVVGSSNIDLISRVPRLPRLGETLIGHSFHLGYGGKGANQAVMAAKLGARVTMVTRVGRDVFGEGTLKNYTDQGIDTRHVRFDEERFSGVAPIFVDDNAENFIVIVPGANTGLTPDDARAARDTILAADVLCCQLEIPLETTLESFRIARSGGVRTILNPAPAMPLPDELLHLADICAPNEVEIEQLTGRQAATLPEMENAARELLGRGPRAIVMTIGDRGALLVDAEGAYHVPAVKVEAVDPTGAGDAFIGSLAVFIAEGLDLREATRRAVAVASLSVTRIGTQTSFPDRGEAEAILEEQGRTRTP